SKKIYFNASLKGTRPLFSISVPANLLARIATPVRTIATGKFDINGIVGQYGNELLVSRTDMNRAAELYSVDIKKGTIKALTHVNDASYQQIKSSRTEMRMVKTKDGKDMGVWVIYPPNFDPPKKYPTL